MASLTADAIVCAVRAHGEHGAILRALTEEAGLIAGYVRGGRSRRLRPILMPGNLIVLELRARTEEQLGGATVELLESRAPLLAEPLASAAIDWATSLTASTLPESQPYPALYSALSAVLDAIGVASSARQWAAALARYELLLLAELGFGLNLEECVVTGSPDNLAFISPKSGGAVSAGAAAGYEERLFRLPPFLRGHDASPPMADVLDGLIITGHFIDRDILDGRNRDLLTVRERLVSRLGRAVA
ncbi:DNA repair protein RecO [Sphingopyxis sp. H038]|uniref:DNA repair protein RecO n=1 Tax=unclassified Sphingopyxis TaxID=2614943 RepID=UPI0007315D9A|nr:MULTISPECIES: DNA repair protein RecO [unclassified Sphingopyxis]KTE02088.1 DNA repair protein RecO [Sphingopyxis sp. H012]KTE09837.1 DNA repair protein RecO [Sphingopyxis sp. H053]KTE15231.1 DNA repair protein RecO [Sphingopyxis sp. H093]KTE29938.1 DNA repair protein RecO [Sphingopyxis sp. H080]KTE32831.1 DNA repair protein RecO [Sphingopyxis sp. H038]